MKRIAPIAGEWIDRRRPLSFRFEGRSYSGFTGDTISSALLASGVAMLGRSFKYHRPRSVLSFANHDVNAMMQAGSTPNVRADVAALAQGLSLTSVNTHGGLERDRARYLDWLSPFLPVGFYYKAFHSKRWFPMWERMFRVFTGLGRVDVSAPTIKTPKRYDFCDVLVVGAGPAGLSAALAAAEAGARVVLADENARAGGSGGYDRGGDPDMAKRTAELVQAAQAHPNISPRCGTTAAGYYADHWVPLVDAERMTKLRAGSVVVATGAFEQPAVFRNNDLPGVMLGSAAQRLIYRYAVQPGTRAVVLAANAHAYRAALDLRTHGVEVAAIVDLRPHGEPSALKDAIAASGIKLYAAHCLSEAHGSRHIEGVSIVPLRADGDADAGKSFSLACDTVLMSVGWAPATALLYQAGAKMRYASNLEQFVPAALPSGVFAAGRVNGVYAFESRLADGTRAGLEAARFVGRDAPAPPPVSQESDPPSHPYPIFSHPKGKNFVDFDEDLQLKDFANAVQEGFDNIELLKRYTTVGMGPSQGKHSNMNAIRILSRLRNEPIEQVGTTTSRPFFHPVPMSHLAGRGFQAQRATPMHGRHAALGASFMPAGVWQRPEYYAQAGKSRADAIREEVLAVRNAAGLIDVGTLGKIDIFGSAAGEFLERVYTGRFANMKAGTTRYGVMTDESGVLIDDGVIARLGEQHFYFTTTTSGAATVYRELTRLNTVWQLECGIVNVTGAMAAMNLAGPKARGILGKLTASALSDGTFPYLAARQFEVAGIPARLLRVGFVGELGYEIHVPADGGGALWDALMDAGKPYGIRAFGVEAQRLLRLEKGHLIVSQDTDGLTDPFEANCAWAVKMDKPFFVGQRSLAILAKKPRKQLLVGFELPGDERSAKVAECHLAIEDGRIAGRVTSIAHSPTLGRTIGLAMLDPAIATEGRRFAIRVTDGSMVEATVVRTPFYDADGLRQKLAEAA
ncbi:MAG: 2Fe-2S iron-sulfur cluster-binding protein [Proteobacteria bacterium]|nr:2Fe-2S iron-sulfur cluster-binding protein [Pseudomonadota bacterium]